MNEYLHADFKDLNFTESATLIDLFTRNVLDQEYAIETLDLIFKHTRVDEVAETHSKNGINKIELQKMSNIKRARMDNILAFLEGATLIYHTNKNREKLYQCTPRGLVITLECLEMNKG